MNLVDVRAANSRSSRLVLLAMGFTGPRKRAGGAGRVELDRAATSRPRPPTTRPVRPRFLLAATCAAAVAGGLAIREGRQCARGVDEFLMAVQNCRASSYLVAMMPAARTRQASTERDKRSCSKAPAGNQQRGIASLASMPASGAMAREQSITTRSRLPSTLPAADHRRRVNMVESLGGRRVIPGHRRRCASPWPALGQRHRAGENFIQAALAGFHRLHAIWSGCNRSARSSCHLGGGAAMDTATALLLSPLWAEVTTTTAAFHGNRIGYQRDMASA